MREGILHLHRIGLAERLRERLADGLVDERRIRS
jgi:hypothetical protein